MKKVSNLINKSVNFSVDENFKNKLLNDNEIFNFVNENNITEQEFMENMQHFYEFYCLRKRIKIDNYTPNLLYKDGNILIEYSETKEYKENLVANRWYNRIKTEYIPKSVLNARFTELTIGSEKAKLAKELIEIANLYLKENKTKGLYIYGKTGIGKSYLLGCVYNYFKLNKVEPAIIYFPEFVRKMKAKIANGEYINIIDEIRTQDILLIDDIGAENITEFVRDEILVPIVSYRAAENLLTFFTSNLSIADLNLTLSQTKNTIDETKSMRILDRIRYLAKPVYLEAQNEREF